MSALRDLTAEEIRLKEAREHIAHWQRWGSYLSERQWGTVREDYSANGDAWSYFSREQAPSRAYRWGEDGLMGLCDNHQRLCFAIALWNGKDPILKERLFGLTNVEGNHGEDVKECYFYLENTPSHSYMKSLYRYPQREFPYRLLLEENRRRTRQDREFELTDTGVFDGNAYFDVFTEYAKADANDILIRIEAVNRGADPALLHLLPTLWFRNTWSWKQGTSKPRLRRDISAGHGTMVILAEHLSLGTMQLSAESPAEILFTENETNHDKLFGSPNASPYVKDAIGECVVQGRTDAVNPLEEGTKAAIHYSRMIRPRESWVLRLRLSDKDPGADGFGAEYSDCFERRKAEKKEFYAAIGPAIADADERAIREQACAGLLWTKQFYNYVVTDWLEGDPAYPPPPEGHRNGRNKAWEHVYIDDILSVPDKWEYPWFAAWDLAFHCVSLALVDPDFAKKQLVLLTREWYMHPNGQLPAYEWAFDDVNPPVHAWAAWRVYKTEEELYGRSDRLFLERVFQKLLLNFTWWVNRKDRRGNNIFEGGFLGLDNIGVFDRSQQLPAGGCVEQSDATSWMAMYSLNLLVIAIELAKTNPSYEDIASKFFEHFLRIAHAMNHVGEEELSLWNEADGFFYDTLRLPNGTAIPLRIRSLVGLIPLFAVETLELSDLLLLPGFLRRMNWFLEHRPEYSSDVTCNGVAGFCERRILSIVHPDQLRRIVARLFSEDEFLSPFGIRSLSRYHRDHPYSLDVDGTRYLVSYEPGEASVPNFGGNSNWRGPVWWPANFLMIEALRKFHSYLGDEFKVEFPAGSGTMMSLLQASEELSRRLISIFKCDAGDRAEYGQDRHVQGRPAWTRYPLFYEYFNGDTGEGLGASHQTGWTGLVANLIQQRWGTSLGAP